MSEEWDAAQAAMNRAMEIYPNVRHFRDLFQNGAQWQREQPYETVAKAKADAWDEAITRAYRSTLDELEWPLEAWLSENPYREAQRD